MTGALKLSKGQLLNIYTDSKYAYLILHAHAAIWKGRQFKTAIGEPIKHCREIDFQLLYIFLRQQKLRIANGTAEMGAKQPKVISLTDCQARNVALYETLSVQTPLNWTDPVEQEKKNTIY